ncbi:MAG: phosphotransferase [Fimbriimonadaceae bacterium]|nr:phosphotransferase [Fimbriimonadaceae bacterium]
MSFDQLSDRQQSLAMRRVAECALPEFGLEGARLELVMHAFNTTFRARHSSGDYAIRINVNSSRVASQVAGEVAWVESLFQEGHVLVPEPRRTLCGSAFALLESSYFDQPRPVVCFGWVNGRTVVRRPSANLAYQMGATMAALHHQAMDFILPDGASRPVLKSVLEGEIWLLDEPIFNDSRARAEAALDRVKKSEPPRLTHFDLHFRNVRQCGNRLAVFDFDDSVFSWPLVDAAQSMFYIRRAPNAASLETAFWNGLGSNPSTFGASQKDFEDLVMGRAILLANELLKNKTANIAAYAGRYIKLVRRWLVEYHEGGAFRPVGNLAEVEED